MWKQIKRWFEQNGFTDVANNMQEVRRAWEGRERELLGILKAHRFETAPQKIAA